MVSEMRQVASIEENEEGACRALFRELHHALSHLSDLAFQRSHPFGQLLAPEQPVTPSQLRDLLLATIDGLRPPSDAPPDGSRWRAYRYLTLRYLEEARPEEVARALGLGDRQARRVHAEALRTLLIALSDRLKLPRDADRGEAGAARPAGAPGGVAAGVPDVEGASALESELSRIEAEQSLEPIDVQTAIADAVRLIAQLAANRSVTIDYSSASPTAVVMSARVVLRQVFLSVLNYLIHFESGRRITVAVVEKPSGADIGFRLSVSDGRAGSTAFDERASALALTRRLVEGQGGSLAIETSKVGDVAVRLTLPTVHTTLVLVVDDNPDVVRLFSRYLHGTGYRLAQARNGTMAHEMAVELRPDVIILDLMMPVQDGWDVFQQLRSDPATARIPIIVCSILPEMDVAVALGAAGSLAKPVTREALRAALEPYHLGRVRPIPARPR